MADLDEIARKERDGKVADESQEIEETVQRLKKSIEEDCVKSKQLQEQTDQYSTDERVRQDEELLQRIGEKVRKVYHTCGFNASDSSSTLAMLEHIELAFDSLLRDETKEESGARENE